MTVGDLDGDGDLDIATTNSGSSSVSVFRNNGSAGFTPADGSPFAVGVSPGGIVMGDFNEDGVLDLSTANFGSNTTSILINDVNDRILFQSSDGTPAIWLMNGLSAVSVGAVGPFNPGPSWHVKDSGDFNGDGKSDILWQNDDGTPAIWLMDGTQRAVHRRRRLVQSGAELADQGHRRLQRRRQVRHPVAGQRRHAGDLADGRHDRAVQQPPPARSIRGRAGRSRAPATSTATASPTSCGRADDGTPAIWLMDGIDRAVQQRRRLVQSGAELADQGHRRLQRRRQVRHPVAEQRRHARDLADGRHRTLLAVGAVGPFNPGPSWHIKGTGDFNGDGKSDILWQNDDGTPAIWLMDGMNVISGGRGRLVQSGAGLARHRVTAA